MVPPDYNLTKHCAGGNEDRARRGLGQIGRVEDGPGWRSEGAKGERGAVLADRNRDGLVVGRDQHSVELLRVEEDSVVDPVGRPGYRGRGVGVVVDERAQGLVGHDGDRVAAPDEETAGMASRSRLAGRRDMDSVDRLGGEDLELAQEA